MSRRLPSRPNLDHLRNQAKDLLVELRPVHPQWQLADAQHALARSYGFDSWPKLKAHVESLRSEPAPPSGVEPPRAMDPLAEAGAGASALAGTWVANMEQSQPHPANPFRAARL